MYLEVHIYEPVQLIRRIDEHVISITAGYWYLTTGSQLNGSQCHISATQSNSYLNMIHAQILFPRSFRQCCWDCCGSLSCRFYTIGGPPHCHLWWLLCQTQNIKAFTYNSYNHHEACSSHCHCQHNKHSWPARWFRPVAVPSSFWNWHQPGTTSSFRDVCLPSYTAGCIPTSSPCIIRSHLPTSASLETHSSTIRDCKYVPLTHLLLEICYEIQHCHQNTYMILVGA